MNRPYEGYTIKAIINAKLIINNEIIEGKTLLFDKRIVSISDNVNINNVEVIDANENYVSAGFIDLHIHGSGGADVMDASPEALEIISSTLLQTGTTSFLPTTMTMSKSILTMLYRIFNFMAQMLRVHRYLVSISKVLLSMFPNTEHRIKRIYRYLTLH